MITNNPLPGPFGPPWHTVSRLVLGLSIVGSALLWWQRQRPFRECSMSIRLNSTTFPDQRTTKLDVSYQWERIPDHLVRDYDCPPVRCAEPFSPMPDPMV